MFLRFFVGYLVWGFLIIYLFTVLIGVVIIILRIFVGDALFGQLLLKIVPAITVIIFKRVLNIVTTRIVFLNRKSKILALDNFRAFNVFLYFNFYFDCFMGVISAIIRLVRALLISIFMLPSKNFFTRSSVHSIKDNTCQTFNIKGLSYSFLGRHWERMDNAYACYSGFLHMESSKNLISSSIKFNLKEHLMLIISQSAHKSDYFDFLQLIVLQRID